MTKTTTSEPENLDPLDARVCVRELMEEFEKHVERQGDYRDADEMDREAMRDVLKDTLRVLVPGFKRYLSVQFAEKELLAKARQLGLCWDEGQTLGSAAGILLRVDDSQFSYKE